MAVSRKRASRALHMLTAREVLAAAAGDHGDGGGLVLRVTAAGTASWVFRYTAAAGIRREMGLGAVARGSVAQAGDSLVSGRTLGAAARGLLQQGIDPIDERERRRQEARADADARKTAGKLETLTLARAAREYHEKVIEPTKTPRHAAQWISSLENHLPPEVWHAPVTSITAAQLLDALLGAKPHVNARNLRGPTVPETVRRIRQRLDALFENLMLRRKCASNPAAACRRELGKAQSRGPKGKQRALPYKEVPAFMAALQQAEGIAARALEFTVLTAARTNEVLDCTWAEFSLADRLWICPAERMKAREAHVVGLSERAVEILLGVQGLDPLHPFPSTQANRGGKPMSNMAMLTVLDRLGYRERTTVHGLRASFSTWANETAAARPDVIEACLAHKEGDRIRASYNRSTFDADRRALLSAWSDYCSRPAAPVIELKDQRQADATAPPGRR